MKVLIVYDSLFGNTHQIAEAVQEGFQKNNEIKLFHVSKMPADSRDWPDLLVVGTPTHGGHSTGPVKNFISSLPGHALVDKFVAAFDTSIPSEGQGTFVKLIIRVFKNAAPRLLKELCSKGGREIGYEIFWVKDKEGPLKDGESERAKKMGRRFK
ncbi:MAG: flavodoxin family protein [Candidatus Marinimicrobia bacterium]|nr:flavodoxin family protein [Candidatus Neomarinimicrobiota bacterium]